MEGQSGSSLEKREGKRGTDVGKVERDEILLGPAAGLRNLCFVPIVIGHYRQVVSREVANESLLFQTSVWPRYGQRS